MALPYPQNPALLYHSVPFIIQFLTWFAVLNYNTHEWVDRQQAAGGVQQSGTHFDFIIVGGGTTGSVLANRLSADPAGYKVLLLEAGGEPPFYSKIPILSALLFGKVAEDWKYTTVPQEKSSQGLEGNVMPWPSGRGLGGSSILNGMIYIRGTVQGFDTIANLTDDSIWSMENVLRYYKKTENYYGFFQGQGDHGKGGGLTVSRSHLSPYIASMESAFHELGYETVDPNADAPVREGFSPMDLHLEFGRRASVYDGYLKPILNRTNLIIRRYSYVYKVLFEGNKAVGVEYVRHSAVHRAYASREVILSAGAIQTPKILMLSGIGPQNHLEDLQIPVRVDLPVGEHLQDKYGAFIGPFAVKDGSAARLDTTFTLPNYGHWLLNGLGSWATSQIEASYAYRTNISRTNDNLVSESMPAAHETAPDIHTYVITAPVDDYVNERLWSGSFGFKKSLVKAMLAPVEGRETFWQLVNIAKPTSVGTLRLRDADPFSPPLLDPNYFGDGERTDLDRVVEGVKFSVRLVEETSAFKGIDAKLVEPFPGCEAEEQRSDDYWRCVARKATGTAYKYGGTAPIGTGTRGDGLSVVNSRLGVHGVSGLRVVDGSVLQEEYVSVNMVTCTMLGELASDFILKEYTNKD